MRKPTHTHIQRRLANHISCAGLAAMRRPVLAPVFLIAAFGLGVVALIWVHGVGTVVRVEA